MSDRETRGYLQMKKLNAVFLGLARDCERFLANTIARIEATGGLFNGWNAVIVENDSQDGTPERLERWADENPNVTVDCRKLGQRKWGTVRNPNRGQQMAEYRNRCKRLADPLLQKSDVAIVVDLDLADWELSGLANTFSRWGEWDGVASNGLRWQRFRGQNQWVQADAWAFRRRHWGPRGFGHVAQFVPDPASPMVRVLSAFGGLAVYRSEAYRPAYYSGGDCEHVTFHRHLINLGFNRLYLNPAQRVTYDPKSGRA